MTFNDRAFLVSTDSLSSKEQLECLNEWLDATSQLKVGGIPAKVCEACDS